MNDRRSHSTAEGPHGSHEISCPVCRRQTSSGRAKIFLRVLPALAPIFFWSACAVGPDFTRSSDPLPDSYDGARIPGVTTTPADVASWWKVFHDPVLDSLIDRTLASNLGLRQAVARITQARAGRGIIGNEILPNADVNGSVTRAHNAGSDSIRAAMTTYRAGLDASWEIDLFGRVRRNIEAADADFEAAVEAGNDALVLLTAETATTYVNLRGFQQQLRIARSNLEAQKKTADITRRRFQVGVANGLDAANAEAQVSTTEAQIPVIEGAVKQTMFQLSVLAGREPTALVAELSLDGAIPITPPDIPIGLPSDLVRRRPDIRRNEALLHSATAKIGAAKADYFPRFSLTGTAGYVGSDKRLIGTPQTRYWTFGPSLSLPLFDIARVRWNVRSHEALRDETLAAYRESVLTALMEVESALVAYGSEKEHQKLLEEAVKNNRRAVELAKRLYTAGKTDFLNVSTAERSLFQSEDALVQSTRNLSVNLISLYKALGGGW